MFLGVGFSSPTTPSCRNVSLEQVAYYGLLQMFLTKRAVCILVCDAEKFSLREGASVGDQDLNEDDAERQCVEDIEKLEELRVCEWLRCLSWRVPGCDVLLVATKCDKVTPKTLNGLPRRMGKACRSWLGGWSWNNTKINVEQDVSLTSCAARGASQNSPSTDSLQARRVEEGWPCDVFRGTHGNSSTSLLRRITHKPGDSGCRGATMIVPRGWDIALTAIDALSSGRRVHVSHIAF